MHKKTHVVYINSQGRECKAQVVLPKRVTEAPQKKLMTDQYCKHLVNSWDPRNTYQFTTQR